MIDCAYCQRPLICDGCQTPYLSPRRKYYESPLPPAGPIFCPELRTGSSSAIGARRPTMARGIGRKPDAEEIERRAGSGMGRNSGRLVRPKPSV